MNFKTTAILFGLLICTLWVFGLALQLQQGALDEGLVFPSLKDTKAAEVTGVDWKRDKKYVLTKTPTGWTMKIDSANEELRLDETKVKNLIDEVVRLRKNDEAELPRDAERAGLKPAPQSEVVLRMADGKTVYTLYVGKKSPDEANVFVRSSDRPDQMVPVKRSSVEALFVKNMDEMRSRRLLEVTDDNTSTIELVEAGKTPKTIRLERRSDGHWRFKEPKYGLADFEGNPSTKNTPGVRGLINSVGNIQVGAVEDFVAPGARTLEDLGLVKGKETYRIEVKRNIPAREDVQASKDAKAKEDRIVTEVLLIGQKIPFKEEKKEVKPEEVKKEDKDKDKENKDQYYARLESDKFAVKISARSLETALEVLKDPANLRNRDLTLVEATAPDAVDLKLGKEEIKLRKVEPTLWKMFGPSGSARANGSAIDASGALIDTVRGKGQVKEFFDPANDDEAKKLDAKFGLDQPSAVVELYINAVPKPAKKEPSKPAPSPEDKGTGKGTDKGTDKDTKKAEPKQAEPKKVEPPTSADTGKLKDGVKPVVKVEFGRIDRNNVYVKRTTEDGVSWLLVPVAIYDKVAPSNGELAFLDDKLPKLAVIDATKLELARGGEKLILEKLKKDKDAKETTWQFIEPKDSPIAPDSEQVTNEVIDRLATLNILKWVKRTTPNEDLEKFGLKSPAVTATVTTKLKPEDKGEVTTFSLSKEFDLEKEKVVYALRTGTDLIFQVPPALLKGLQDVELRDRTIFKFEAAKVREIKLEGWKEAKKFLVQLDFKRVADNAPWVMAGLAGFHHDNPKVSRFAAEVAGLKCEKFIRLAGGKLPEHKLAPAEAPLVVTLKMDDGKTTHTLTFGALNSDKTGYFAEASALPGVVFLLSKMTWDPLLNGYEFFELEKRAGK